MGSTLLLLVVVVLSIGFLMALLFYGLVFPLWGIIDCAASKTLHGKTKALWITAMMFLACFAAAFYGILKSENPLFRRLSKAFFFFCVGLIVFLIYASARFPVEMNKFKLSRAPVLERGIS